MNLLKNRNTRALILTMCALVLSGIVISHFYYKNINESIDPRIAKARTLYEKYNVYAQNSEFDSIFLLMDSIELIYTTTDHYKNSYETGVLYNNRAASFLTMALYSADIDSIVQDSLVTLAETAANRSIEIYQVWLDNFGDKSLVEIEKTVSYDFYSGLENYSTDKKNRFLKNRIKEIEESQTETKRRLSVSYTNLGIVYRHQLQYESAADCYKKAIDLWDQNLTAENNLNVLLGRPLRKRNIIQKLFPPEKG